MAILNSSNLTAFDRVVRDLLYDATGPGAKFEQEGITVQQLVPHVNTARGTATTADGGSVRRAFNKIEQQGLLTKRTLPGKRTQAYKWTVGTLRPLGYKHHTVNWNNTLPVTSKNVPMTTAVSSSTGYQVNSDLDKALADALNKASGAGLYTAPVAKPKPKIPRPAPVTRPGGELYIPRELAGKSDVETLRKLRDAGLFPLVAGPPGSGKTAMLEAAFNKPGELFIITGDAGTKTDDFIGQWYPTGKQDEMYWSDGPLVLAMRAGGVLFIDDATLIDTKEIACVYPAMDGRKEIRVKAHPVMIDGKMQPDIVKAAPGFSVVAAHNPGVAGAILSDALASRFTAHIWMESDLELAGELGVNAPFIKLAENMRTKRNNGDLGVFVPEMRELLAARDIAHEFGTRAAVENLLGKAPEDFQKDFAGEIKALFGSDISSGVKRLEVKGRL